jgi:hypothetical protein
VTKYGTRTDADWALLRETVPSFAAHWRAYTAQPGYNPLDVGMNVIEFESHLANVVAADPEALAPLFVVMERYSPGAEDSLDRTISILETLATAAEEHGVDLRRLACLLPGPVTRDAWRQALTWTHPECTWDDERGLVPDWPPPVPVGRVRVTDVPRGSPDLPAFPLECELLSGTIGPAHFVWKRLSSCHHAGRKITAVDTLASPPESPVQLRVMLAYHDSESPDDRPFTAGMWYDPGEVLEIIEQLPPEKAMPATDDRSASGPAI